MAIAIRVARFAPREALGRQDLWAFIRNMARRLAQGDRALCDDLQQEAALAVLTVKGAHTLSYLRCRARWKMRNYLRGERRRRKHEVGELEYARERET